MLTKTSLKDAIKIDFTGKAIGFKQYPGFQDDLCSLIRTSSSSKLVVVVDRGFGFKKSEPHVVHDHLNLTGGNPLVGANDPCGERFPSVNDIYVTDISGAAGPADIKMSLPGGIAAGLKSGVVPDKDELALIHSLGADFCCYNLVPTMIVAAHAGLKVLALVIPQEADVNAVLKSVQLTGED